MSRRVAREGLAFLLAVACAGLALLLALLLATDDGEPGGCSSDVECRELAGEPEPPTEEKR